MTEPPLNASASAGIVVSAANALRLSDNPLDDFPSVFATTRMIALMELASARLLHPLLQPGEMSVGVTVDINHSAPTPVGAKVTAAATYRGRDGKLFVFDVVAHDPAGEIGRGRHKRAIISQERLLSGAKRRGT